MVELPPAGPAPGTARIVAVARFRIVRVLEGKYAHAEILVGFDGVAGLPGKVGERDRLVVVDRMPAHATLLNAFAKQRASWALPLPRARRRRRALTPAMHR